MFACATICGDSSSRYSSAELRKTSLHFLKLFSKSLYHTESISRLIYSVFRALAQTHIQPHFMSKEDSTKHIQFKSDSSFYDDENQQWKRTDFFQSIDLLEGCALLMEPKELGTFHSIYIPTILLLLDDYQIQFKERGLSLLNCVFIDKITPNTLRSLNIAFLFYQRLISMISYHDHPILVKSAFESSVKLIHLMHVKDTKEFSDQWETFLVETWMKSMFMCRGKVGLMEIHLEYCKYIVDQLNILTVKHLTVR